MFFLSVGFDSFFLLPLFFCFPFSFSFYFFLSKSFRSFLIVQKTVYPLSTTFSREKGLWFAGGDQWTYYDWWKNTPLQNAVQDKINQNITIGGTSAGMAILAAYPFTAEFGGINSSEVERKKQNNKKEIERKKTEKL